VVVVALEEEVGLVGVVVGLVGLAGVVAALEDLAGVVVALEDLAGVVALDLAGVGLEVLALEDLAGVVGLEDLAGVGLEVLALEDLVGDLVVGFLVALVMVYATWYLQCKYNSLWNLVFFLQLIQDLVRR
jgi:hypothetical protein